MNQWKHNPHREEHGARGVRALAAELKPRGRRLLHLSNTCAWGLNGRLKRIMSMESGGDEALRRLKLDAAQIEACLRLTREESAPDMPAAAGGVRILLLARRMIAGGELRADRERLLEEIAAFDGAQPLEMDELLRMPAALRIALCEALNDLARDVLHNARLRMAARRWILRDGRGRVPRTGGEAFLEHALALAAERELPELHARIERIIDRRGERSEYLVERAHRAVADSCLRLENLMGLRRLLEALDWDACFDELCTAEIELREDPAQVYGGMDASSKDQLRRAAADMARRMRMQELPLVRYGLRIAREACEAYGAQDPRSTVCWYFLEDEGRDALRAMLGCRRGLPRRVPDAGGRRTVILCAGLTILIMAMLIWAVGRAALAIYTLPLAWVLSLRLIGGFYPRWVKPCRLPRMKIDAVPEDARTLVTLPVLLSSADRAREMVDHMEALGCLERDENIDYLILGDFRDADEASMPGDGAILQTAREGVARLNAEAGRKKYFYLHRERSYREADNRWMGENRKRGALTCLNRLLLGSEGADAAFRAEGVDAAALAGRYRYVVTLDADTEYLPGTLQKLIGAMRHPLNRACIVNGRRRGYAVLQPNMQLMAEANVNAYVGLTAGEGGVDSYPVSVSDFYQDMTGRGSFAGKGIYDVRAFAEATEGMLPDDVILSHDLIEGILCGAAYLSDVSFYDACPDALEADLTRLHRWTRGDWQLLPVIFSRLRISAVDRMKMLGNLLRSLHAPALTGLFIHSVWADAPGAFILGLLLAFQEPLLQLLRGDGRCWKAAILRLAVLPLEAGCMLDAILRTLWRLTVSRKHLMEWVPAADAGGASRRRISGRIAALLILPGLLRPFWVPAVLALAALFFLGADWADDLARTSSDRRGSLDDERIALLDDLARRTWRFFETYVPEGGCGLPPDNVQLDPPVGAAMRTSPTNIGLYLMSCISARELDYIDEKTMVGRMTATIDTLERLEKWHGQLYNWYDISDLSPLRPRYVSAVDSGNLAGALLLCARIADDADAALARRMRDLAEGMDLAALYDAERKLFRIGMDAESGRLSESHYDLYASEARILSYAAMMLGQADTKHWKRLSRACVRVDRDQALVSWSGTMFEYLMPEIIMRSYPGTLAGQSRRSVTACQMRFGRGAARPWGVSESGYYAFDIHLNYQYRAFGLRSLALSGSAVQDVVAPYAAALALAEDPCAAADNLDQMRRLGWCGEMGMYEAADYLHPEGDRRPRLVRSHMAHHQGMILCALCNALKRDVLSRRFMEIPQARALRLLLQEKSGARVGLRRSGGGIQPRPAAERPRTDFARRGRSAHCAADTHLLFGAGTTALVTARGGVFAWRNGLQLNRFSGDLLSAHEGMYVHIRDEQTGEDRVVGSAGECTFDAGAACFCERLGDVRLRMRVAVSPEDGGLYQQIELENGGSEQRSLRIDGCLAVALAPERDMRAHPTFQNLFVESERRGDHALIFRRREREPGADLPEMIYLISDCGAAEAETSLEKLVGRRGSLGMPGGLADEFTGGTGCVLNPCGALRVRRTLAPGEHARLHFALALAPAGELAGRMEAMDDGSAPDRAIQLSSTQTRAVLGHAGVDAGRFRLLQRASVLIFDPRLRAALPEGRETCEPAPRKKLWQAGISGDLPILLTEINEPGEMNCVREAVRMHAFYRMMGVKMDFVLINSRGSDYHQPARGALGDLIASSHMNGCFNRPGGAYLLEKQNLEEGVYEAIRRGAALYLNAGEDAVAQLRSALDQLLLADAPQLKPMEGGKTETPKDLKFFNGYGGFDDDGGYAVILRDGVLPPAPWSNVLASERAGAVVTERGGGFAWAGNSRSDRLTAFANDPLREGWGWMFYLMDEGEDRWLRLLPGDMPMTEFIPRHEPGRSTWTGRGGDIAFEISVRAEMAGLRFDVQIKNEGKTTKHLRLAGFVDWLMGTDISDAAFLRTWSRFGACFASGAGEGVGCFIADDPQVRTGCDRLGLFSGGDVMNPRGLSRMDLPRGGWTLHLPLNLRAGEMRVCRFLLGSGRDVASAYALAREFRSGEALRRSGEDWPARLDMLRIETPDPGVNLLLGGFVQAQILNSRIRGRTGLYQPGGAYGFRDQLQDMLPMIHYEPERVRRHLLHCAARQFEDGDVLHWWHEPYAGVRTRIRDDLLFLPYVTAQYVKITGDASVLRDSAPYLEDMRIPDDAEDIYAEMRPSAHCETLHEHCMRAFHHAARVGEHGLCLMGAGDWNDGMNRVGAGGRGESIWLSEFLAVCAAEYAPIAPREEDCEWLLSLNERLRKSIEAHGWDGEWYLRAYADSGRRLGGRECACCRIDAISQAWAVLAGLDGDRCRSAMDAAWQNLADEELKLIRLLNPPFDGGDFDPGYIAAYPEGVRENGGQYTHAACWMLCALVKMGDGARAHRALEMLLPMNHALDRSSADIYRVEPYVMAADIYTHPGHEGRGGWTWYTGSAGWMLTAILMLLGYERRGRRVRMHALLDDWPQAEISLRFGLSSYRLVCARDVRRIELDGECVDGDFILLTDDGREHTALFPPRIEGMYD